MSPKTLFIGGLLFSSSAVIVFTCEYFSFVISSGQSLLPSQTFLLGRQFLRAYALASVRDIRNQYQSASKLCKWSTDYLRRSQSPYCMHLGETNLLLLLLLLLLLVLLLLARALCRKLYHVHASSTQWHCAAGVYHKSTKSCRLAMRCQHQYVLTPIQMHDAVSDVVLQQEAHV